MKLLPLLLLLLTIPAYSKLNGTMIVNGRGEVSVNKDTTIDQACIQAESKAIKNALEKYSGKEFSVEKKQYCFDTKKDAYCNFSKDIDYTTSGTITALLDKNILRYNQHCMVDVMVEIEPSRQLKVDVSGKKIYTVGDQLDFTINAQEPLYYYVFVTHSKGVDLLFPNQYNTSTLIDSEISLKDESFKPYFATLDGVDKQEDVITFLFTKHKLSFEESLTKEKLKDTLSTLPVHSRRVFNYNVLIERRNK